MAEPHFTPEDQAAFREYWAFYSAHQEALLAFQREGLRQLPELAVLSANLKPEQIAQEAARMQDLLRAALVDGQWSPFLETQKARGVRFAGIGLTFGGWFKIISRYREGIYRELAREPLDSATLLRFSHATDLLVDAMVGTIAEAFLDSREKIIQQQEAAIRELSIPVLQVRDRQLVIPLVGLVDTQRARHLTQALLAAVKQKRARLVVMDITGVPVVDSKVANHLVEACEAARLMGAGVIISGVSQEIAQALVSLGAILPGVETAVDLQTALENGGRRLAADTGAPPFKRADGRGALG